MNFVITSGLADGWKSEDTSEVVPRKDGSFDDVGEGAWILIFFSGAAENSASIAILTNVNCIVIARGQFSYVFRTECSAVEG